MNDLLPSLDWHAFSTHWILTLAHFLWQGAAIGLLTAVVVAMFRHSSARLRHGLCLLALGSFIPCLVVTWMSVDVEKYLAASTAPESSSPDRHRNSLTSRSPASEEAALPQPDSFPESSTENTQVASPGENTSSIATPASFPPVTARSMLSRIAPLLAAAYCLGVLLFLVRTSLGLWGGRKLRILSQQIHESELVSLIEQQARRIGLKTAPVVMYCSRVAVPTVIGFLKPVVLLPASLVTHLQTDELAAILSHEFAHIRRHDLLVNLAQRLIESVLFFHPAVWWISRRISLERENCCDDLASASGFGNVQYAGALLRMAELSLPQRSKRFASQLVALSAEGQNATHFSRRIERLLNVPSTPRLAVSRLSVVFAVLLSVISVGVLAQIADQQPVDQKPDTAAIDNEVAAVDKEEASEKETLPGSQSSEVATPNESNEDDTPDKPQAPPKGLEFLTPYPKLYSLSLDMTEVQFLTIVQREKLKIEKEPNETTYLLPTGDGHIVIVMFGNNGNKCSGIQRIRGDVPEAKTPPAIVDSHGISWSEFVSDGFRVGGKVLAKEGQLTSGERLIVQYVLMNETEESKTISLGPSEPVFPSLGGENRIELSLFPANAQAQSFSINPRQFLEDATHRAEIDTTGFPPGQYLVMARNFFWRPDRENPNHKDGFPARLELPLTIISKESDLLPAATGIPTRSEGIDWGEPVAGLQVGSRFVGESTLFAPGSTAQIQLFVRNITSTPIDVKVFLPYPAEGWLINVENPQGKNILLERTPIDITFPVQSVKLKIAAGETLPLTGVKLSINDRPPTEIKNSSFRIERKKPEDRFWEGGILVSQGGEYRAIHTVSMKRDDIPGVRLKVESGKSAFQVSGPKLKRSGSPVSLHGFELTPYRSTRTLAELVKSEPMFNKKLGLAEGGSWRCWVDSNRNYSQWWVYYAPGRQAFYVVDWKSEPRTVYGPIEGDAITKLRLLDGSSDLVASNPDEQNKRRASEQHERRVESLLESSDSSLRAHGLKAFIELGHRKIYELKKWDRLVASIADSAAGRGKLKLLVGAATRYLQQEHARIEAMRVKLDDSEYRPSRKPTPEELALPWGPVNDGLSLAVSGWPGKLRYCDVKDRMQVDYLIRNSSDSPKRVSTLNVLDGVRVTVTDEESKLSALLGFPGLLGIPLTERYRLQPGEVVTIKSFSFEIREGDLHPAGKALNSGNLPIMYGYVNLRPSRTYTIDFSLTLPSAYSEESNGQITMPAKGEFDGQLTAKPLRLALRGGETDLKKPSTGGERKGHSAAEQAPIQLWKARLVDGMTGKPLPGITVRVKGAVTGNTEPQPIELVSSGQGIVTDGTMTVPDVLTEGWWLGGWPSIGQPPANPNQPAQQPDPKTPREIKLWRGDTVTGKLLYPDKSPAGGVLLNVGVYINHMEWKKRLGMDLTLYSFDHGEWANWSRSMITNQDGTFTTTVPPKEARSWVRVGTTTLGFASINPERIDAEGTGRALATCVPFEANIGYFDTGFGYKVLGPGPQANPEDGTLNFGTLQLKPGIRVRGRVVDADGNGVAGIRLTTTGAHGPYSGRSAWSGADGRFEFLPVEAGSLMVHPDARLRDAGGNVVSREVQAVFIDQRYTVPPETGELVVEAVPHVELEFEWIDRRAEKTDRVSYDGFLLVIGRYPLQGEEPVYWSGETRLIKRDGRKFLVVKVPRKLMSPRLVLVRDKIVTASYEDETGKKSGPGQVELGDITRPIHRIIYGDEPAKPE